MKDVVPPWLVKKECQCRQPGVRAEPVTTEKKENEPVVKTEMEVDDGVVAVLKVRDDSGMFSLLCFLADSLLCAFADSVVSSTLDEAEKDAPALLLDTIPASQTNDGIVAPHEVGAVGQALPESKMADARKDNSTQGTSTPTQDVDMNAAESSLSATEVMVNDAGTAVSLDDAMPMDPVDCVESEKRVEVEEAVTEKEILNNCNALSSPNLQEGTLGTSHPNKGTAMARQACRRQWRI